MQWNRLELGKDGLTVRLKPNARLRKEGFGGLANDPLSELAVTFSVAVELHAKSQAAFEELLREGCGLSIRK